MDKIGIEFTFNDGSKDSYDPIDLGNDFKETDTHYILDLVFTYEIEKSNVKSIRYFPLCECGFELYPDGCHNLHK